jgi:hypothetical protein
MGPLAHRRERLHARLRAHHEAAETIGRTLRAELEAATPGVRPSG